MEHCEHCREMKDTREQVAQMYKIITGNGRPQDGLAFRVAQHAEFVGFWKRFGWLILGAIIAVPPTVMAAVIVNILQGTK